MWSCSPAIPAAPLELISIGIPISPCPTYSSEYEASMINNDDTIWKDGDEICYPIKSFMKHTWKSNDYHRLLTPQPNIHTRVEVSQPTLSPYITCVPPPPSPSPCSPIPHRCIRPASTSPVRFTFTPHHILSSQRRALIIASKQLQQQSQDIYHGDVSCYPSAPITLKLDKKWMTTSISAPLLTNVAISTPEKTPIQTTPTSTSTPTPTPTPTPTHTPTPVADCTPTPKSNSSSVFLQVPTVNIPTPSSTPLKDDLSTPTPFSDNSITPSYTTPSTWRSSSSSSTPLAPRALPTLSVRISISSPSPLPSTCPMAPRCLDPWITPEQRIFTPSMISSY